MPSEQSHKMSKSSELSTKPESKSAELHKSVSVAARLESFWRPYLKKIECLPSSFQPTTSKTMRAAVITKVVPDSKVPWDQAIDQTVKIKVSCPHANNHVKLQRQYHDLIYEINLQERQIQQPRKDEVLVKARAIFNA